MVARDRDPRSTTWRSTIPRLCRRTARWFAGGCIRADSIAGHGVPGFDGTRAGHTPCGRGPVAHRASRCLAPRSRGPPPAFPMLLRSPTSRMPLSPAGIVLLVVVLAALGLWRVLPVARAGHVSTWPGGDVRYFDATGMAGTVDAAAARWNASGARVHLRPVRSARDADVVFTVDDRRLLDRC